MPPQEALAATVPVIEALVRLGVRYYVGGSLASSAHGVPRSTLNADLVADLTLSQVPILVAELRPAYYIHEPQRFEAAATSHGTQRSTRRKRQPEPRAAAGGGG